jgi:hypothetical protein
MISDTARGNGPAIIFNPNDGVGADQIIREQP